MRCFALAVLVFIAGCAAKADLSVEQRVDALFAAYAEGERPGYAIGVMRGGELVLAKGYGLADIEAGRPITADTAFNLASLSKQFTGAAVALEIERAAIDADDRLADHWPDLPDFMGEITVAHLVYMTSGLKEYYTLPSPKGGWLSEDEFTVDDALSAVFASGALDYAPGTRWTYSNINYQLLAVLAGRLNDASFAEHMAAAVFEPLGMTNTWVDAPLQAPAGDRARSYVWEGEGWRVAPRLSPHYGGSGMFSSINDLAKWDAALYRGDALGAGFKDRMLSTRRFEHDKDNDAFGLVHGDYRGLQTIWYEGGDYGVSTYMVRMPERDETVICLANFGQGRCADKARAVIDVLLAFAPPPVRP
ncbi:MAG: serine hydrolase domain-containing protein [Pseudomonadota bacterium]